MKLVNYKRGYIFECTIHGTIYMTFAEWQQALKYISDNRKKLDPYGSTVSWRRFLADTVIGYQDKKYGYHNVRVTATEMLAKHFGLNNYKHGNYQIAVER